MEGVQGRNTCYSCGRRRRSQNLEMPSVKDRSRIDFKRQFAGEDS
jgi:hypothetical protein